MGAIWYLLKCPEGKEEVYTKQWLMFVLSIEVEEVISFQYLRMLRYGGEWHPEKRTLLPGYVFLSASKPVTMAEIIRYGGEQEESFSLIPCEIPYLKDMCQEENLVGMSKGIIREGIPIVTNGPLKGQERLIKNIDRHKRTAKIEIPFAGGKKQVTVGLEIYEKQI